ncbi:hypothetical protein BJ166DRAFT_143497 [Pestalotiopsis sp. NC0098]|nr:hypothetical protein BJ166DRAFT_143497 [Pestalotiopsis sp. NC0098]
MHLLNIVLTTLAAASVSATPVDTSPNHALDARDKAKLNHLNDRNILYHAAPPSMRCYNLDDKTGAFFLNTGGYLASAGWFHKDCGNWVDTTYAGYTGKCYDKGDVRSIMVQ